MMSMRIVSSVIAIRTPLPATCLPAALLEAICRHGICIPMESHNNAMPQSCLGGFARRGGYSTIVVISSRWNSPRSTSNTSWKLSPLARAVRDSS